MSVCYTVKFGMFSNIGLEELMASYQNFDQEVFCRSSDNEDAYFLFTRGSIRGVSIRQEKKKELAIRCNVFTSDEDIRILHHFFNWLADHHKARIIHESGMRLTKDQLSWESMKALMADNQGVQIEEIMEKILQKETYIKLPIWDVDVILRRERLAELRKQADYPQALSAYLQQQAFRIFQARRASQITTDKSTISVWAYDDALLYPSQIIAVNHPADKEETIFLAWTDFFACPLLVYEEIPISKADGSYYFVSGIEASEQAAVFEYFRQQSVISWDDI